MSVFDSPVVCGIIYTKRKQYRKLKNLVNLYLTLKHDTFAKIFAFIVSKFLNYLATLFDKKIELKTINQSL